jgi:hypothetical protein
MTVDEGKQTFTTSDGREMQRPRRRSKVPSRYQKLIDGELDFADLDEEELFRGRLRGADGHFRGRPPLVIPHGMHQAYVDHVTMRLEQNLISELPDIMDTLISMATGGGEDDTGVAMDVRARVGMYLTDRILGRPTERKEVAVNVQAKWEQVLSGGSILVDIPDPDIIDAELVEDPAPALPSPETLVERPGGDGRAPDGAESPKATQSRPKTGVTLR